MRYADYVFSVSTKLRERICVTLMNNLESFEIPGRKLWYDSQDERRRRIGECVTCLGNNSGMIANAIPEFLRRGADNSCYQVTCLLDNRGHSASWPNTLRYGVDQLPYSCKMMIVVFGDKIQMVHQSHRRLQTRVGNGPCK
jgi:hypothetical protein